MRLKAITGILLTVFLLGMLTLTFNVQPVAAPATVDWWPMFHHDLNHTGYSTSTAPNTNNTIWTYTTGDAVASSPAVVDGRVYAGSNDNKSYCLDASTGTHIWNYTTGDMVLPSPAIAGGKVYVGSLDAKIYCLDASTGTQIWSYTAGDVVYSPAVAGGNVYVGSADGKVYAFGSLVLSTDSAGNSKATFDLTDNVCVRGQGFTADTNVTIYLIPDGSDALPANAVATASTTTDTTGDLPVTLVWSQPLTIGEYDVWVDENQNGVLDGADVWNSQSIDVYPLYVIPEFFTLTSMLVISIIITTAVNIHKRRQLKKTIH